MHNTPKQGLLGILSSSFLAWLPVHSLSYLTAKKQPLYAMMSPQSLILLSLLHLLYHKVIADYSIRFIIDSFVPPPGNRLSDDTCCVRGNASGCFGACNPVLRACFRESHPLLPDRDLGECVDVISSGQQESIVEDIEYYYAGEFLLDIRAFHSLPDGSLSDTVIDQFLLEAEVPASLNMEPNIQEVVLAENGEFFPNSSFITVALTVRCEMNFFGEGCERKCSTDGTHCRIVHLGPIIVSGYTLPVADSVVIGVVLLTMLGVFTCFITDLIYRRRKRKRTLID